MVSNYSRLDIKSLQHTNKFKPPKLNTLKYFSLENGAGRLCHCGHHLSLSNASSLTVAGWPCAFWPGSRSPYWVPYPKESDSSINSFRPLKNCSVSSSTELRQLSKLSFAPWGWFRQQISLRFKFSSVTKLLLPTLGVKGSTWTWTVLGH